MMLTAAKVGKTSIVCGKTPKPKYSDYIYETLQLIILNNIICK